MAKFLYLFLILITSFSLTNEQTVVELNSVNNSFESFDVDALHDGEPELEIKAEPALFSFVFHTLIKNVELLNVNNDSLHYLNYNQSFKNQRAPPLA